MPKDQKWFSHPEMQERVRAAEEEVRRLFAVGFAGAGGGDEQSFALLRTESALIFRDGFERNSTLAWPGL